LGAEGRVLDVDDLGDAEVADFDVVAQQPIFAALLQQHDVARLDVTMDDPTRVGSAERRADLGHDSSCSPWLDASLQLKKLLEVASLQELHRDVQEAALRVRAEIEDPNRVRVIQMAGSACFVLKALEGAFIGHDREDLDRDGLVERHMVRAVDLTECALAHLLDDPKLAFEEATDG
jgi:hypothetical protein